MSSLFKNLPLPTKLMLIGIIPLVFLIIFAIEIHQEKKAQLKNLEGYRNKIQLSSTIMKLINELQIERRYSFRYAEKNLDENKMLFQRAKTDSSLAALEKFPDKNFRDFKSFTFLDSINKKRKQIDDKILSGGLLMTYYTNTIFRINTLTPSLIANISELDTVYSDMAGQKSLAEMITYLGLLRAGIYSTLFYPKPSLNSIAINPLKSIYDIYNSFYKEYTIKASITSNAAFLKARNNSDLKPTLDYTENFFKRGGLSSTYSPEEWWDISGSGLHQLDLLLEQLNKRVQISINAAYDKAKFDLYLNLILLCFIIAFVLYIVFGTIKNISDTLKELRSATQKIAAGSSDIQFTLNSDDVIGSLAKSILEIDAKNNQLAKAAEAIGQGNFNIEVVPRSEEDILGNAVVSMKQDLQQFNKENREKIWIQTGVALLATSVQGEKSLTLLTKDSLNALVNYIEAEIGLFYITNENKLFYYNGYAIPNKNKIPASLQLGETLIGQAALDKKIIYLKETPDEFVRISSGSGSIRPNNVIVFPLIQNGFVEGVIEIGALNPFQEATIDLIKEVSTNIALALHATKNRVKLQELFEETQAQAEELQSQHSELENINTELEAQTQKLQASEEELKVQQEELLQANKELEERAFLLEDKNREIVQRNIEIQKKAEELAQSTQYKSEFLANMSHELRTPLNSILLLSRLMGENAEKNLSEDQLDYARVIQSSGNGLLTLIDEILDLSKIESGKMDLEYHQVSVKEIVNDLQSLFLPVAKEKNLQLLFSIDPVAPAFIETDKLRLEQILKNLIANALKFTPKGSVSLVISIPEDKDSYIRFAVKDTGIGIGKEKHQLIFEAFQQEDGTTRRKFGGTGLGLSISLELAKLLRGDIDLASETGKGSEFIVTIPQIKSPVVLNDDEADIVTEELIVAKTPVSDNQDKPGKYLSNTVPLEIKDDRESYKKGDKYILIVEDDTLFAKALLNFAHQKGYKGIVAVRGDAGIELAKKFKPLAILLDIQLPVKDGWQVMEELKTTPETRHIPVHIMSSIEAKKESLLRGAIDFINKPVALEQMQEIFKKLEEALSKGPRKVLIIEENSKHAQALAHYLNTFKINAEITHSINDVENVLLKEEVECVILDNGIPDQNAFEKLETVKQNSGLEDLPVIIFTGKNLSRTEEIKLKQYADSIVLKTAHSYKRILDEVGLFLHLVEEKQSVGKEASHNKLGVLNEVLKNKIVLITDDDVRNIFSLTKALEHLKMKVLSAIDGAEALKVLEENGEVDVILMDIMMPEMDGYQTIKRIRKNPKYKNIPILAVTAKAMTGDREKCISAGASDYISKPIDIDQLVSLLRVWLYDRGI